MANENRPTLLIVDDEPQLRMLFSDFLSGSYNIYTAENGSDALSVLQQSSQTIDCVLTDIQMPVMDGISLLKKIQELYPTIGIILISGQGSIQTAVEAMRLGAFDYITKPILAFDELEIRIKKYFEKRSLENQLAEFMKMRDALFSKLKVYSFASFDVVDSLGLKLGADMLIAQYSFMEYHRFMREKIEKYHGKINSTAGDGIMCSFESAQSAVEAAIEIQHELDDFNRKKNKLSNPFRLRCGIHTGSAVMERDGSVERAFASVLDVAGHIQKRSGINEVVIGKDTFDEISSKNKFIPLEAEVDGIPVFSYKFR